jgi:hypothetical protein
MVVSKQYSKLSRAYNFFKNAEDSKLQFTLENVSNATGWSIETVRSYRSKKWRSFVHEVEEDRNQFICRGFSTLHEDVFFQLHAQQAVIDMRKLRPRFDQKVNDLIDKARESALLAIQIYNNPLTTFRIPGYLTLMNIAFTSLFHAILEYKKVDYIYKYPDNTPILKDGDTKAWELSACADYYFAKGRTIPERENLRFLTELRNKIEHRFLPQLDLTVSGHCQAMLLNFEALMKKEFGAFFSMSNSLALALQFSEIEPFQRDVIKHVQTEAYSSIRKFIDTFQSDLPLDVLQSPQYAFRVYLIPRIGNHATSSDLAIEFVDYDPTNPEDMERYEKDVAMIRERRVQVADQGKLLANTVVKRVKDATGLPFTTTDHTKAWKLYDVRPKSPSPKGCKPVYCQYSEAFNRFVYTEQWIKFLIKNVQNPQEFQKIRNYKG